MATIAADALGNVHALYVMDALSPTTWKFRYKRWDSVNGWSPEVVLFDEPTTGLDPIMSDSVGELILETQKALNTTYVVITHDIPLTYKIADKIAMLHEGRIIEQGSVDEMKSNPNPVLRQFLEGRAEGPIRVY